MAEEFVVIPKDQLLDLLGDLLDQRIDAKLDPLMQLIAVKQRDACGAAGVTDDTARNKVKRGEIQPLTRDGSNRVYFTLETMPGLKARKGSK